MYDDCLLLGKKYSFFNIYIYEIYFIRQENLKKAFMRGVCALNFEAMNILQSDKSEDTMMQTTQNISKTV